MSIPRVRFRPVRQGKLVSGPAIASPDDEQHLIDADKRFQATLDHAIKTGSERVASVADTVRLKRHTRLSR